MFSDSREPLVEASLQVLCVTMENESSATAVSVDGTSPGGTAMEQGAEVRLNIQWMLDNPTPDNPTLDKVNRGVLIVNRPNYNNSQ